MNQPCRNLWYALAIKMWIVAAIVFTTASTAQGQSMLQVGPASLTFSAEVGEAPPSQVSTVTTSDGAPVFFFTISFTTSGGNWLSGTPFGVTPGSLVISVNPTGLAVGTYFGTVTVTSSSAANSPLTVAVTLNVVADNDPIVVDANQTPCITTDSARHFTTIQSAVNSGVTFSGATINVCPGNYAEQIVINKSVTLRGVTNTAANTGAAVIAVPSSPGLSVYNGYLALAGARAAVQVLVQASDVNIVDVAVDGTGAFTNCSSPSLVGVGFDTGSSGTLRRVAVRNQNIPDGSGGYCGNGGPPGGYGIFSQTGGSVTVQDSSVRGFASYGFAGSYLSATGIVIRTTVFVPITGASHTICVFASAGTVQLSNNTVANCDSGLGVNFRTQGTITGNTITNTLTGIKCSVQCSGGGVSNVSNNTIANAAYIGIGSDVGLGFTGTTFQYNDISGAATGIDLFAVPLATGNTVSHNTINDAQLGILGVNINTVSNNTFLNVTTLTQ